MNGSDRVLLALGGAAGAALALFLYGGGSAPMFFLAAVLLVLSSLAMHRLAGVFNLRRLTIPAFWYFSYIAVIFIPAFFVYFEHPGRHRDAYILSVESVLVAAPIGVWLASRALRFSRDEIKGYYDRPIEDGPGVFTGTAFSMMALAALVLTVMYIRETPTLPLLYLIKNPGDAAVSLELREEAYALLDSKFNYAYFVLKSFVYPFLISAAFCKYLVSRKNTWLAAFLVILTLGVFYSGITTSKSQVAAIFMVVALIWYIYKNGRVGTAFLITSAALVIAFPALIFALLYTEQGGAAAALSNVGSRLFGAPADVTYYYFEIFPDNVGYLHGGSIGKFAWLTGGRFFDAPVYVKQYMSDFLEDSGSANGAFIGDANANFGVAGVVAEGLLVGAMLQTAQIYVLRQKKTALSTALFAFLLVSFWMINITALQVALLSDGVLFSIFLYWIVVRAGGGR